MIYLRSMRKLIVVTQVGEKNSTRQAESRKDKVGGGGGEVPPTLG